MDKRLKAAVLILSMNLSLAGPYARLALAEGSSVSLMLPAGLEVGKSGVLRAVLGEGTTVSDVTFSVQVKNGIDPQPAMWEIVGFDADPADDFTVNWQPPGPGEYWVRAVANGTAPVEDVETVAVSLGAPIGYHLSGSVALNGSPGQKVIVRVVGQGVDLTAVYGEGEKVSAYGRYAVVDTDANQQPLNGQVRYYFDLPAGSYQITAYTEGETLGHTESAQLQTSSTTAGFVGYGTYYVEQAPPLAPGAQGPWVQVLPITPSPQVGKDATVVVSPSASDGRSITQSSLWVQPQSPGGMPHPDAWTPLNGSGQTGGSYSAVWKPQNAGAYWLKAEVVDSAGARTWSVFQAFAAEATPVPSSYPIQGEVVLYDGLWDPSGVTVTVSGPGLQQPVNVQYNPQPAQGTPYYLTDGQDGKLRYFLSVPQVGLYTVSVREGEQVVSTPVATTATGAEAPALTLAVPAVTLNSIAPAPVAGQTIRISGTATPPPGRQLGVVFFGYQPMVNGAPPDSTKWEWRPGLADGNGAFHFDWVGATEGNHWIGMVAEDSAGARVMRTGQLVVKPAEAPKHQVHGTIKLGPNVQRNIVAVQLLSSEIDRTVQYSGAQAPEGALEYLIDGANTGTLQYRFEVPAGVFKVRATAGNFVSETEITVGENASTAPLLDLPPVQQEQPLPRPQFLFLDADLDHVYFKGSDISIQLSGLESIPNGTEVVPEFTSPTDYYPALLLLETTAGPFIVNDGRVTISGKLNYPSISQTTAGRLSVQLKTPIEGQPLTEKAEVAPPNQRAAHFVSFGYSPGPRFTTDLSAFPDLYNTNAAVEVRQEGIGSIEFGPGLNLLSTGLLGDVLWAVDMFRDNQGFVARINPDSTLGVGGRSATLRVFGVAANFGLSNLTPATLNQLLKIGAEEANGTVVHGPAAETFLDLAAINYDAANDTLTIPVKQLTAVHIHPNVPPVEQALPRPQVLFNDTDVDHVYFPNSGISIQLSGLASIADGTAVVPVITVAQGENPAALRLDSAAPFVVNGGSVTLAGTLNLSNANQIISGPLDVQLQSTDGQPLTEKVLVMPVGQRSAYFASANGMTEYRVTPALAAVENLYNTTVPIDIVRDGIGAVEFGSGLNLMVNNSSPDRILQSVEINRFNREFVARVRPDGTPGLLGLNATVKVFGIAREFGLTGLTQQTLGRLLVFSVEELNGTVLTGDAARQYLPSITYDQANDTLWITTSQMTTVRVNRAPTYATWGNVQLAAEVEPQTVEVNIKSDLVDKTLYWSSTQPPNQEDFLVEGRTPSGAPIPGLLNFQFVAPAGEYTITATAGDLVHRVKVTVGPNPGTPPNLSLPPRLPVPQVAYTDGDADHVYFPDRSIGLELSGLQDIPDGTAVKPVISVPMGPDRPALVLNLETGATFTVNGGRVALTGMLRWTPGTEPVSGPMDVELMSADGLKPLTERRQIEQNGKRAYFSATAGQQHVRIIPELSSFNDLYNTSGPLEVLWENTGSVTFGSGLNLLDGGMPNNITWSVDMNRQNDGLKVRVRQDGLQSLLGRSAMLKFFNVRRDFGLEALTTANLAEHLIIGAVDSTGNLLTGQAADQYLDLAAITYDPATDTLQIPVHELTEVRVSPVPRISLTTDQIDVRNTSPTQLIAWLPPITLPADAVIDVRVEDLAGQIKPGVIEPNSIRRFEQYGGTGVEFRIQPGSLPLGRYKVVVTAGTYTWAADLEAVTYELAVSPFRMIEAGYTDAVELTISNLRFGVQPGDVVNVALFDGQSPVEGALNSETEVVEGTAGQLFVRVTLNPGIAPRHYRLEVSKGDMRQGTDFRVLPPYNVRLYLTDGEGKPLKDTSVGFRPVVTKPEAGHEWVWTNVDWDGYAYVGLTPGAAYTLSGLFTPEGFVSVQIPVSAPPEGAPDLELNLPIRINTRLTVLGEDGQIMPQANLAIRPDDGTGKPVEGESATIRAQVNSTGVAPMILEYGTTYHLVGVDRNGSFKPTALSFTVGPNGYTGTLRIPTSNVQVRVLDQADQPLPHVTVKLMPAGAAPEEWDKAIFIETDDRGIAGTTLQPAGAQFTVVEVFTHTTSTPVGRTITVPAAGEPPQSIDVSLRTNVQITLLDESGLPMPNTWVMIKGEGMAAGLYATTNGSGVLSKTFLPGVYRIIEVGNPQRPPVKTEIPFTVTEANGFQGNLALPQRIVSIAITGDGGQPVPDAHLQIRPAGSTATTATAAIFARTDSTGVARLDLDRGASYVLVDVGTKDGVVPLKRTFTVPLTGQLDLSYSIAATVQAPVQNEDGLPMLQAMVTIKPDDGQGKPMADWTRAIFANTGDQGVLKLNLPPGTYHVVEIGSPARYVKTDIPFTVGANVYTAPLRLPQPNVRVAVTGESGAPVGRAIIQIRPADARPDQWDKAIWIETDQSGIARAQLTPGQSYRVIDIGTPNGVRPVGKEFTVPNQGGQPVQVDISLVANVVATVHDDAGNPMAFAMVAIRPDNGSGQPVEQHERTIFLNTNGQGGFSFNLEPGVYHVVEIGSSQRHIWTDIRFTVTATEGFRGTLAVPAPNVRVTVTNGAQPVGKAWVQIRPAAARPDEWSKSVWVETDQSGVARASLSADTKYVLVDVGTPQGVVRLNKEFTTPAQGAAPAEMLVSLAANVAVTLKDENGAVLSWSWVTIKPDNGNGQPDATFDKAIFAGTNAAGLLSVNLDPGRYHVVEIGNSQMYVRTDMVFEVTANGFTGDLSLPAPNVRVTVTGDAGPVRKAWVQIRQAGARPEEHDKSLWSETDENGMLKVRLAPQTEYTVVDVATPQGITQVNKPFTTPAASVTAPLDVAVSLASNVVVTLSDEDGAPMPMARVTIRPVGAEGAFDRAVFATTDAQGVFRINLEAGQYRIVEVAAQQRYVKTEIPFTVAAGGLTAELGLPQPNVTISVTNGGTPLARAWVQVRPAGARPEEYHLAAWTQTDANGVARMQLTAGAEYVVIDIGTPQGVTLVNQPFTAPQSGDGPATVNVSVAANVTATLNDENGNPLTGAWVTIRPDGVAAGTATRNYFGTTDAEGRLTVNLPAGRYRIVEIGSPQRFIRTNLLLDVSGGTFTGTLAVDAPNVRVAVTSGGSPVARAMVQFRPEGARADQPNLGVWAETDQSGVAKVRLTAGNYVLVDVGTPQGVTQVARKVTVAETGLTELTVSLTANVISTLRDESGAAMAQSWLIIKPHDPVTGKAVAGYDRSIHATTDANGTFRVNLPEGTYHVVEVGSGNRYVRTDLTFTVSETGYSDPVQLAAPNTRAAVRLAGEGVPFAKVAVVSSSADPNDPGYWNDVIWFQADEQGNVLMELAAGEYVIRDVDLPTRRYSLADAPVTFLVGSGNEEPVLIDLSTGQ